MARAHFWLATLTVALLGGVAPPPSRAAATAAAASAPDAAPQRLSETGLYVDGSTTAVRPGVLAFAPQYPLWTDGARKRRWIQLPPGTSIDASDPDAWEFPPGTRLWKEFGYERPVETRFIERLADGSWRFATYVWDADGRDARLAPAAGAPPVQVGARRHVIPSEPDCRACHEGARVPVLGFSALQLSHDRDPLAPHAEATGAASPDLPALVAKGWLKNLPRRLLEAAPRIAANSPLERAALGYLHGNCGHCHGPAAAGGAAVPVGARLALEAGDPASVASVLRSLVGAPSRYRPPGESAPAQLVVPGRAAASVLPLRMRSRDPRVQMPPLGTLVPDTAALALIERWIDLDVQHPQESRP